MESPDHARALERIQSERAARSGHLDLSELQLSALPEEIYSLPHLQSLDCSRTQVSDLAPLQTLSNLQSLDCVLTQVSDLAPLQTLSNLQSLNCLNTQVSDLAPLQTLANLQSLDCSSTQVSDLDPLQTLANLQSLDCSKTQVSDLDPLQTLSNLQGLYCSGTQVSDLAPLQTLSNLQGLYCSGTQVSDLAPLQTLSNLQSLNFSGTQVSDLAPLQTLSNLQSLNCSRTQVSDLAPLQTLSNLQSLDCSFTQVSDLALLVTLPGLQTLACRGNSLKDFSRNLLFHPKIAELNLYGSTIPGIPREILTSESVARDKNCLQRLRAHVRDLEAGAMPLRSLKILVLGNGGVGKTQLCRHLAAEPFDPAVPSTHGIAVRTIQPASPDNDNYVIWDFGGQDIYHSAHTLFMRSAGVFVVVWTPELEAQLEADGDDPLSRRHPLAYWLDCVRTLGRPGSPVVLVQSQCDRADQIRPIPPVPGALLESFACLLPCSFSARTQRGAAALREALRDAAQHLRQRDGISTIGKGRQQVWQQLETWRQEDQQRPPSQRQHRTISQDDFLALCERIGGISSADALLRYLNDSGVVFHRPELFRNRIILDQSWALDAIYAVLERNTTWRLIRSADGRFSPSLLAATVWQDQEPYAQRLLLSLMETCGIAFRLREADAALQLEDLYLAPDLLPERSADSVQIQLQGRWLGSDPQLTLTYRYPFLHDGLVRSLLCDVGRHAGEAGVYWRYGAWVYEARQGCLALLEQRLLEGRQGEITLRFKGAGHGELAEWFTERLAERHRQFGYGDLQPLRSGPAAAADLSSDAHTRGRRADDEPQAPDPQLGTAPATSFQKLAREVFISYSWGDPSPEGQQRDRVVTGLVEAMRQHSPSISVQIDREAMQPGQLISAFMDRLAASDRVILVISDKYLRSEYCMTELFQIYRNRGQQPEHFHRCVIPLILADARLDKLNARLERAVYWQEQAEQLESLVQANMRAVGTVAYNKSRLIGEFARHTSDMLELLVDQLQPRDAERLLSEGFSEICAQLLAD